MAAAFKAAETGNYADTADPLHTFGVSIAANDIIVVALCVRGVGGTVTIDPATYTEISNYTGDSKGTWAYKVASGSETQVQLNVQFAANDPAIGVVILSGVNTSTPIDGTAAENEANITGTVTSTGTGTTNVSASSGTLVSCCMGERGSWITSGAWTNATERCTPINDVVGTVSLGTLDYTTTGNKSDTYSHSGTASNMYGAIAGFQSAAGGGSILPFMLMYH